MPFEPKVVLVTGAAGFIGSSYVRTTLASRPDVRIVVLDALTYAGNLENLASVSSDPRYAFSQGDITREAEVDAAFALAQSRFGVNVDAVVHFAAESHVDRSIEDPSLFLRTNVLGNRDHAPRRPPQGSRTVPPRLHRRGVRNPRPGRPRLHRDDPPRSEQPLLREQGRLRPRRPRLLRDYGFPVLITRCSNNYGPYQFPEKLIPLMIANALEDRPLPVYGDGGNVRDWIWVDDHSAGVNAVLERGTPGEVYNLGGESERTNLQVVRALLQTLGKPESLIAYVTDRLGHDRRYAVDTTKSRRELGWAPTVAFEDGLARTVAWYRDNPDWVRRVRTGEYLARDDGGAARDGRSPIVGDS